MSNNQKLFHRLYSIDMLRGLIILFMLLDHVRETFYLHAQVSDPMDVTTTGGLVFASRLIAHVCAPTFIFLTGLSAYLYGQHYQGNKRRISAFLFKRGIFLIVLELTVINFAWTGQFPPTVIYLQVIWAIGLSMIALSLMLWLPTKLLIALSLIIIVGHNAFDSIHFDPTSPLYIPWAIIHDRSWLVFDTFKARTSYPVLPWIGVIGLGYCIGPLFKSAVSTIQRTRYLLITSALFMISFIIIRGINIYGDKLPWQQFDNSTLTVMSFFNITKYPPSLLFLLFTLSIAFLLLALFENISYSRWCKILTTYGRVPMFFYIIHLYFLKLLYISAVAIWGLNKGSYFGVESMWQIWLITILVSIVLYPLIKWFATFKADHKNLTWLKYL